VEDYYSAVDAAKLTGITRRQLDYWVELGMIKPAITAPRGKAGSVKLFDYDGLFKLSILGGLIKSGFSIQALRKITEDDFRGTPPEKRPNWWSTRSGPNSTAESSYVKLNLDAIIEAYKEGDLDNWRLLTEHGILYFSLERLDSKLRKKVAEQKNKKH